MNGEQLATGESCPKTVREARIESCLEFRFPPLAYALFIAFLKITESSLKICEPVRNCCVGFEVFAGRSPCFNSFIYSTYFAVNFEDFIEIPCTNLQFILLITHGRQIEAILVIKSISRDVNKRTCDYKTCQLNYPETPSIYYGSSRIIIQYRHGGL